MSVSGVMRVNSSVSLRGVAWMPLGDLVDRAAGQRGEHDAVAVASNESHRNGQVQQTAQRFAGHRARHDVAPDHDAIDPGLENLFEHGLERRQVAVDVVERGDAHGGPRLAQDTASAPRISR
jgi:hypothetical protein